MTHFEERAEGAFRLPANGSRLRSLLSLALTFALLAAAWIGRAAISSDGAEVLSDTFGYFVTGRLESATVPPRTVDPMYPAPHPFRSRYGVAPSLLAVPFLAPAWPFRTSIGAVGLDAAAALMWAAGAGLAAWAFLRLARVLRPGASPFWAPAFLAGTFLWPYAADSYTEPWAAAALALGAAGLLRGSSDPMRAGLGAGLGTLSAALLKPMLWVLAPAVVLAALARDKGRPGLPRAAAGAVAILVPGLAGALALNAALYGRATDFGYGYVGLPFDHPLSEGLAGLLISPGRGLLFFAPVAFLAPFVFRRLSNPARVLCGILPLVLLLVVARWFSWHGASCWGPRLLLPALPLLAAPAVLLPRAVVFAAVGAGVAVNVLGVLAAPGAFITYAEMLGGPATAGWPRAGSDRVSTLPLLAPPLGHAVLVARGAGIRVDAPWLAPGVLEGMPLPPPSVWLFPAIPRRLAGLPPITPISALLLARIAVAEASRGRPELAALHASESLALDPGQRYAETLRLLAEPRSGAGAGPDREIRSRDPNGGTR
ncbi:MAG: hypothetical protein KBB14_05950 [Thermoanaerobaculia bacterium]|nr:hypothetical protein [Thermoanaerobaculia bacterium]